MSSNQDTVREVFGRRAAQYTHSASHTDAQVLARVVELAAPSAGALALDIATGAGHTALALAPHCAQVYAVDLTPAMLDEARALARERGITHIAWQVADVLQLPFDAMSFDIVTCRRAAHHFPDLPHALGEMHRVLKPGGRLVIDDRSVPEDDDIDAILNRLDVLHDPSHVRQYPQSAWRTLLTTAGFSVQCAEGYTRSRPITSFTDDIAADQAAEVAAIFAALTPAQRAMMGVETRHGELFCRHWFVTLSAFR